MQNRENVAKRWLTETLGYTVHNFAPLAGDASFRRYFRVGCNEDHYILMDAPPAQESCADFIDITQRLMQVGVRTPVIHHSNLEHGFLLLDDLSDALYLNCLNQENADGLYRKAIDTLLKIQTANYDGLPLFDEQLLLNEMYLFTDWYCTKHLEIEIGMRQKQIFDTAFKKLVDNALMQPTTFVHRDYHSRNLLLIEAEDAIGVLDYQDAVLGPITYDLVSLLQDCYIAWPTDKIIRWVDYFQEQSPDYQTLNLTAATFKRYFDLMGVQRHFKASGIFARLYHRDGKDSYLNDIPRTLNYITDCLANYPEFTGLRELLLQLPTKR